MRTSASGSVLRMCVAIDHTVRLAPSIRPPIEPVVSTANTTSTGCLTASGWGCGSGCGRGGSGTGAWSPRQGWRRSATVIVAAAAVVKPYVTMRWRVGMALETHDRERSIYGRGRHLAAADPGTYRGGLPGAGASTPASLVGAAATATVAVRRTSIGRQLRAPHSQNRTRSRIA